MYASWPVREVFSRLMYWKGARDTRHVACLEVSKAYLIVHPTELGLAAALCTMVQGMKRYNHMRFWQYFQYFTYIFRIR